MVKFVNIWIWIELLYSVMSITAFTLTGSSTNATAGLPFNVTCETSSTILIFKTDSGTLCTILGVYPNGTCQFSGSYNTSYEYRCYPTSNTYKVTIPASLVTETLHKSKWKCGNPFGGSDANYTLHVNVPVSSVTISSRPNDTNPANVIQGRVQTFACTTNAGRPASKIQWFLSTANITSSASPQPDVCNTNCSDDKVISSSVLTYDGNLTDDGMALFCTAVNTEDGGVRSPYKLINILYGPRNISISPKNMSYIAIESGSIWPITCTADCKPNCTMAWSGPNLHTANTAILNLQNLDRNQSGNYQCIARNDIGNMTSVIVSIFVRYGPSEAKISPKILVYTVTDSVESIGPIDCTADCNPECTISWSGPYLHFNISVLYIRNVTRQQAGEYRCTVRNTVGSVLSTAVTVIVQWKPVLDDEITSSPLQLGLPLGMLLNITINLISNPIPSLRWTLENTNSTEDVTKSSYSNINGFHLRSTLILSSIEAAQFGNYTFFASNVIGNFSQRFSVVKKDLPKPPDFVNVCCATTTSTLMWKYAFDGGSAQHFDVQYWKIGESTRTSIKKLSDSEKRITIRDLHPDTQYGFFIQVVNEFGSSCSEQVNCTTFAIMNSDVGRCDLCFGDGEEIGRELFYAGISTLVIGIITIIAAVVIVCRSQRNPRRSDHYIDLNTRTSQKAPTYDTMQEPTYLGTQNKQDKPTKESATEYETLGMTDNLNTYSELNDQQGQSQSKIIADHYELLVDQTKSTVFDNTKVQQGPAHSEYTNI